MSSRKLNRFVLGPTFRIADLGWGDIAFALLLSGFAIYSVLHGKSHGRVLDAGLAGALAVLLMTLPVVWARRRPVMIAAVLAVAALINWGLIGHYVRCGATLPAVFYVAFTLGSRSQGRDRVVGEVFLIGNLLVQCESDPQLAPIGTALFFIPITLAFMGAGYLLRRRNAAVKELGLRTQELHEQRERNAALAVKADRTRISEELDQYLHEQVHDIATAASAGSQSLGQQPEAAVDAFMAIQDTGRETLTHMREMVGNLQESPTDPQPVLAQLDRLLAERQELDVRLQVVGDPRLLPPGLEVSGYRIVEHLLHTLSNDPRTAASVDVEFRPDSLIFKVTGPSGRDRSTGPALAAATERAHLHDGTVRSTLRDGWRETVVLIPLLPSRT
jgi:signal transduction histidine kinase